MATLRIATASTMPHAPVWRVAGSEAEPGIGSPSRVRRSSGITNTLATWTSRVEPSGRLTGCGSFSSFGPSKEATDWPSREIERSLKPPRQDTSSRCGPPASSESFFCGMPAPAGCRDHRASAAGRQAGKIAG